MAGLRLSQITSSGEVVEQWALPEPVSSFTFFQDQLVLAVRNRLVFFDDTAESSFIASTIPLTSSYPHDPLVIGTLPELILPIPNLLIAGRDLRLPGAPRHYRLGVHQGMDFYWGPGREIYAVADGTVLRIVELGEETPDEQLFAFWRNQSLELGFTSDQALDFYRGRQIWIEHDNGLISRYAHLSEINDDLQEGMVLRQGDFIGRVGNSGSPASLLGPAEDSHLHFELWLGDHYLGQYLRPIETRELLERLFGES